MARFDLQRTNKLGMAAVLGLEGYSRSHLPRLDYELVKLRASHLNQCHACIAMHTKDLRAMGESEERLAGLAERQPPEGLFDARERAVLALTDALTRVDPEVGVSDEVWADVSEHFDQAQLANLVLGIATINVWNRINLAARLDA